LSLVVIAAGLLYIFRSKEIIQPAGILAPGQPFQRKIKKTTTWQNDEFQFKGIAEFRIQARVLSIRFYGSDDMSDFCPSDIALGWGKMSDQNVIDKLEIKQQHRWYVWSTQNFPIPKKEIEINSSNIHVIPSNEGVENKLDEIVKGNIILIEGKLVNVNRVNQKFIWKSSTKRNDTGSGACEILWADKISIIQ